jgi:hypothetical protein
MRGIGASCGFEVRRRVPDQCEPVAELTVL